MTGREGGGQRGFSAAVWRMTQAACRLEFTARGVSIPGWAIRSSCDLRCLIRRELARASSRLLGGQAAQISALRAMNEELVPKLTRVEHCCRATPSCFASSRALPAVQPQCARFGHPQVIWTSCRSAVISSASEFHPLRMKSAKPVSIVAAWTRANSLTRASSSRPLPHSRTIRRSRASSATTRSARSMTRSTMIRSPAM